MRIAIIGGGASGMICAWLLDEAHEITVFEAAPILGGHIRTLGRNVPSLGLPEGAALDCGVIEFDRDNFPTFCALMRAIGAELAPLDGGSTGLFFADGRRYLSPYRITEEGAHPLKELAHLLPMALRRRRFLRQARAVAPEDLYELPISGFLDDSDFSVWLKALLMYAYSTDFQEIEQLPAALAVPMLRDFLHPNRWCRIPGGVYTYIHRICTQLRGEVRVNAPVRSLRRVKDGVEIGLDGERLRFDAAVFAAPPDRLLAMLADPTEAERRRFGAWSSEVATTFVHTDNSLYERRGIQSRSEFDLFEQPGGEFGYNAYLNRLCGLPEAGVAYNLAFHLEREVDPAQILHRQDHTVLCYSVEALRRREEVIAANGEGRLYFAGAWLGDGLHEGAAASALRVSKLLGGRSLP